jgi:signal transduction histidine kinase
MPLWEEVDYFHDEIDWYWPVGSAVFALALAVGVTAQRGGLLSPDGSAVWGWVAAVPWLIDGVLYPLKRVGVPVWLFTVIVAAATFGLGIDPVEIDVALFFLVLLACEMASRLRLAGSITVLLVSLGTALSIELWTRYNDAFIWLLAIVLGWAGGFATQSQFRLMARMRDEQATLLERAAADERQRIAREVHDVIAHTLSVTMLHITGARLALERDRPEQAADALADAEQLGRESLSDIRRTVGLLGSEGTGTEAPMPSGVDVPELVDGFRAAGLDVDFEVSGDPATLPPAVGLGIFRIAQESLANVAKHASGSATAVRLAVDRECVQLVVRSNGAAPPPSVDGRGVRGMRERAELLGGTLAAGPVDDGWVVEATIPRSDDSSSKRFCH